MSVVVLRSTSSPLFDVRVLLVVSKFVAHDVDHASMTMSTTTHSQDGGANQVTVDCSTIELLFASDDRRSIAS
jgi:hypothetical protein